jgi:YHS domain-containing protein
MQADPVCGTPVRERGNHESVEYAGTRYFFCSRTCLERFDAQPDLFTAGPAEGKRADRDRGVLPGHGANMPGPGSKAKLEQATVDAGPG